MYDQNIFGPARGNFSDCYCLLGAVRQLGYKTVHTLRFERLLFLHNLQCSTQGEIFTSNLEGPGHVTVTSLLHGQVRKSHSCPAFLAFCEFSGIL